MGLPINPPDFDEPDYEEEGCEDCGFEECQCEDPEDRYNDMMDAEAEQAERFEP